ncbi:hypothetical protein [Saccharopolyspora mangrovi]|uniref:DUF732 domain-containing protein n=1 Tax=Saccharopolyspora mangrovi TaxID=3082379 RepID=A0ABU6AKD3_9PSEU|nr:hypothetical protein [Saccharopolyspora sp. S2-29]MEB3371927.1 hypothetical protein [Saccharopolyspora sp. S2-29]
MSQRRVITWIWVGNGGGLLVAAFFTGIASSGNESTTSADSTTAAPAPSGPSRTEQCALTARQAQVSAAEQGYDPMVIWSSGYVIPALPQAEDDAYRQGVSAFDLQIQGYGETDPDVLRQAFLSAARERCAQYYGY